MAMTALSPPMPSPDAGPAPCPKGRPERVERDSCAPRPGWPGHRIAIIGSGGSGKSTLARALALRLDLPVIHLDPVFWQPGWVETPQPQWRAWQERAVREDAWIIDGTHAPTLEVRLRAADAIVLLDLNRVLCTWRIVKRRVRHRRRQRFDRASGCHEKLNLSFVRWVWTFPSRGRPETLQAIAEHAPHAHAIRLRSRRAVRQFLDDATMWAAPERREAPRAS